MDWSKAGRIDSALLITVVRCRVLYQFIAGGEAGVAVGAAHCADHVVSVVCQWCLRATDAPDQEQQGCDKNYSMSHEDHPATVQHTHLQMIYRALPILNYA